MYQQLNDYTYKNPRLRLIMNPSTAFVSCSLLVASTVSFAEEPHIIAKDICECLKAPYQQAESVMSMLSDAEQSGDLTRVVQSQDEMMAIINTAKFCMENVKHNYPALEHDDELQKAVLQETELLCPSPIIQRK